MPNASDRYQQLKLITLGEQMAAALKAQDWDSVGGIDLRIRECLQELSAAEETLSPELEKAKQQLHQLYARVLPAYADACEKLRQLLLAHIDYSEARSAYLRTGLMQGEK